MPQVISMTVPAVMVPRIEIRKTLGATAPRSRIFRTAAAPGKKSDSHKTTRNTLFIGLVILLVLANVFGFGLYLYSVNGLQGHSFQLKQARQHLSEAQDQYRQQQVKAAAVYAAVRETFSSHEFLAAWVPQASVEFVSVAKSGIPVSVVSLNK